MFMNFATKYANPSTKDTILKYYQAISDSYWASMSYYWRKILLPNKKRRCRKNWTKFLYKMKKITKERLKRWKETKQEFSNKFKVRSKLLKKNFKNFRKRKKRKSPDYNNKFENRKSKIRKSKCSWNNRKCSQNSLIPNKEHSLRQIILHRLHILERWVKVIMVEIHMKEVIVEQVDSSQ